MLHQVYVFLHRLNLGIIVIAFHYALCRRLDLVNDVLREGSVLRLRHVQAVVNFRLTVNIAHDVVVACLNSRLQFLIVSEPVPRIVGRIVAVLLGVVRVHPDPCAFILAAVPGECLAAVV